MRHAFLVHIAFAASAASAQTVIDVAPDGKTYTLMLVDARDENRTILGAYDFETAATLSHWGETF